MIRKFLTMILIAGVIGLSGRIGCADDEKTVDITVMKNDTVIHLCEKYLDDPSNWPRIVQFNRLQNQDLIRPGQKLLIPVRYLKGVPEPGRVASVKGDAVYRMANDRTWKPLKKDEWIGEGASLRTGRDGFVEILFENGTTFTLKSDTVLDIRQTSRKADSSLWQRLILQGGRLILRLRRALGQDERMEIDTPAGSAVARGTDFRVSASDKTSMTAEVLEGQIDVRGGRRTVALEAGYGTKVVKGEAPSVPRRLLNPPDLLEVQDLYRSLPARMTFRPVAGAVSHRAILYADPKEKDIVFEKVMPAADPMEIPSLTDGEYYLAASSLDDARLEGPSSPLKKIRVRTHPLPPFIQAPQAAAAYKSKSVALSWLAVREAASYDVEVAPTRNFSGPDLQKVHTDKTAYRLDFQKEGSYFFRVRSVASDGFYGLWSDVVEFRLIPPPPAPLLEKPAVEERLLRIRWKSQGEQMSYRCQVAQDEHFSRIIVEQKVNVPWIAFEKPKKPGLYFVRTSTIDSDGYEGRFSEPQTFEIERDREMWVVLGTYGVMLLIILLL